MIHRALLCAGLLALCGQGDLAQVVDPWSALESRTGWLLLGELKDGRWATEIMHRRVRGSTAIVPRPGDVVEVTKAEQVVILNYRELGEKRRNHPPGNRPLTLSDVTPVILPPGTLVRVLRVQVERAEFGLRGVWIKVTADSR